MDNFTVLRPFNSILSIAEGTGMLMKSCVLKQAVHIRQEPHLLQDSNPRPRDPEVRSANRSTMRTIIKLIMGTFTKCA